MPTKPEGRKFLTDAEAFRDVSRGKPKPYTLKGETLVMAWLTPSTWRLEIVGDGAVKLQRPRRLEDGTALDLPMLEDLGKRHGIKFLKSMQCLNIAQPLGQGLWEGVPLREVLKLAGKMRGARRIFWWGFHNSGDGVRRQGSFYWYIRGRDRVGLRRFAEASQPVTLLRSIANQKFGGNPRAHHP